MTTRPWREIAIPNTDVIHGTFSEAEFAADLTKVRQGKAPPEYQDPATFFQRTYLTEGMRLLLHSVLQRLVGKGGDPIIQLKTAFGGGKTHSLLTVLHLAQGGDAAYQWPGIKAVLDGVGVASAPKARVVVLDGNALAPGQPIQRGTTTIHTLWGELAWQLGGSEGYAMVAEADRTGTSPGKEHLCALLERYAPIVVLMDESVAFLRQLVARNDLPAGTFAANLSFVQALTESMTATPRTVLLASLPESDSELAGPEGRLALEGLEKYFKRVESIWKPVAPQESFAIVRTRLFQTIGDESSRRQVCEEALELYRHNAEQFPPETQRADYAERLLQAYPIHPEVFDRLYEDWSTLERFQRTRGVLQLMALAIHHLWKSGNQDAFILPGSMDLSDANFRNKAIGYLDAGWEPVVDRDIDGVRSDAAAVDAREARFGAALAGKRVARTIFFGSAPGHVNQGRGAGLDIRHILLGAVQPGQNPSLFRDALRQLSDTLHYLDTDGDRHWFNIRPNLLREMESRKHRFARDEKVLPEIKGRLDRLLAASTGGYTAKHVFQDSGDIPDDDTLRLVVLPLSAHMNSANGQRGHEAAKEILESRGRTAKRIKQNRLIFLAPDSDTVSTLRNQVHTLLAWKSILDDFETDRINLDKVQRKQVRRNADDAEAQVDRSVREAFRWLLVPAKKLSAEGMPGPLVWDNIPLDTSLPSLPEAIATRLRENELLISKWAPFHLERRLRDVYWSKGRHTVGIRELWDHFSQFLYFPRLASIDVLTDAVARGIQTRNHFGYADAESGGEYPGFAFESTAHVMQDGEAVVIERAFAQEIALTKAVLPGSSEESLHAGRLKSGGSTQASSSAEVDETVKPSGVPAPAAITTPTPPSLRRCWTTVDLSESWQKSGMTYAKILDEVVRSLAAKPGALVTIKLDIEIEAAPGQTWDENLLRAIRNNAKSIGLDPSALNFEN